MQLNIKLSNIFYEFNIHEQGIINLIVSYDAEYEREFLHGMMFQYLVEEAKNNKINLKLYIKKLHKLSYNKIHKIIYKNKKKDIFECNITFKPKNPFLIGRCFWIGRKDLSSSDNIEEKRYLTNHIADLQIKNIQNHMINNKCIKLGKCHYYKCKSNNLAYTSDCFVTCQECGSEKFIMFDIILLNYSIKHIEELLNSDKCGYKFIENDKIDEYDPTIEN